METFPLRRKRFDWILVSQELQFHDYATLPDVLSDHRAVVASVRFGTDGPVRADEA
jgi:endonuclease/exonuclease/phosphatase family metal-dependent hydrolase